MTHSFSSRARCLVAAATGTDNLFKDNAQNYSAGPSIQWPVFSAGRLRNQVRPRKKLTQSSRSLNPTQRPQRPQSLFLTQRAQRQQSLFLTQRAQRPQSPNRVKENDDDDGPSPGEHWTNGVRRA